MKVILCLLVTASVLGAQQAATAKLERTSPWFSARTVDFSALTPGPPPLGSIQDRQDMNEVLLAQQTRTTDQVLQAQADDKEEDIFIFAAILGPQFNATDLPLTTAFSQHLREASGVINPQLKLRFGRPRPFDASAQVHPVCEKTTSNSFPSGHSMVGTLEGLALAQIVPERSTEILHRLDQYAYNRVVCGVHYPSDVAASRTIASALFGLIAASPTFQNELASVRKEVSAHLGLTASLSESMQVPNYLANNTVLIVRHAEKPPESTGKTGLTEVGQNRAKAYVSYFRPFQEHGMKLNISALYAGADSHNSFRPRLTLEPLSKESGLPLDATVGTKDSETLLALLRTHQHGDTPLICWRHGQIPTLLSEFGASPNSLLPDGKWPDDVYDWVLVLRFGSHGELASQELVHETLQVH